MAVIAEPKLLLLDEHTAALDPAAAATVLSLTDKFASRKDMCTLMITHNMKDALCLRQQDDTYEERQNYDGYFGYGARSNDG